jgi:hypothetical protein
VSDLIKAKKNACTDVLEVLLLVLLGDRKTSNKSGYKTVQ